MDPSVACSGPRSRAMFIACAVMLSLAVCLVVPGFALADDNTVPENPPYAVSP